MSPPRPRARRGQGDQLREEILAAAQELLVETASEEAVSIRAVAEAVGVTPPSIYRHFPDKDHLLLEVCRLSFVAFAEALEEAALHGPEDPSVPVRQIMGLGRAYIRYAREHPEHYRIMFMSRFELSAQAYAEEMLADGSSFALLLSVAQELIDVGVLRPEIAEEGPLHVGIVFWSAAHGLASLLVAKPGLPWPDRDLLADHVLGAAVRGLLAEPDRWEQSLSIS